MTTLRFTLGSADLDLCLTHSDLSQAVPRLFGPRAHPHQALMITDSHVAALHGAYTRKLLNSHRVQPVEKTLQPGEASKSLATVHDLYNTLATAEFGRDGLLIALGGGVVSDVTGFVAGTWMRGLDWMVIPTTMEAMVDACLGGKTAVNLPAGKNLVGLFHHPRIIYIDVTYLQTLPPRDLRAGLAESLKHALLFDEEFLVQHERDAAALLRLDGTLIRALIARNLHLKAEVVRLDPGETTGLRMLLNFGHTIGHAVEASADFELRHGECVSLGMLAECRLATQLGLLDEPTTRRIMALLQQFELPTTVGGLSADSVLTYMSRDKKARGGAIRFALLRRVGRAEVVADVPVKDIKEALRTIGVT